MRVSRLTIRISVIMALLIAVTCAAVPAKVYASTVGLILPKDCAFSTDTKEKFGAYLREKGIAGKDLEIFMQRPGTDKVSRLNSIRKFLAFGVDVIVVWGATSIKEAILEAGKTPIVFAGVWDPIQSGIISDLKKPGKNVTGVMGQTATAYLLDSVIETSGSNALGVLYYSGLLDSMHQLKSVQAAAPQKGLQLVEVDLQTTSQDKVPMLLEPVPFLYLAQGCDVKGGVYETLANLKKPAATQNPGVTGGGVIFTLAPDMDETIRAVAEITARILGGEKPGDISVARVKKISFTINMGEARNLGLTIPFPVLNRGTEVIR